MGFKTKVLITIDTEVTPLFPDWRQKGLDRDIQRDIFGRIGEDEWGIRYQIDMLNRFGLKAIFFLDTFFTRIYDHQILKEIVKLIEENGHEVQMHVHTEWLEYMDQSPLSGKKGYNIKEFSLDEQTVLLQAALEDLHNSGAKKICAFRAGNWGANNDTLKALSKIGIKFDSSYNPTAQNCSIQTDTFLIQPSPLCGIIEIPTVLFKDMPNHFRLLQINACSFLEIRNALRQAWLNRSAYFVITTHTFELLKNRCESPSVDNIMLRRFRSLCEFLAGNKEKFETIFFSDIDHNQFEQPFNGPMINSNILLTGQRFIEQFIRKITSG